MKIQFPGIPDASATMQPTNSYPYAVMRGGLNDLLAFEDQFNPICRKHKLNARYRSNQLFIYRKSDDELLATVNAKQFVEITAPRGRVSIQVTDV